jgi:hypothetical protein
MRNEPPPRAEDLVAELLPEETCLGPRRTVSLSNDPRTRANDERNSYLIEISAP